MKILQIHTPYRSGGGEDKAVRDEANQLQEAGQEVVQYQMPNPQAPMKTLEAVALAPWNPVAAHRVKRLVETLKPDVAHIHNTWFRLSPSVAQAVHELGVPVIMTVHNYRLLCVNALLLRNGRICEDCVGRLPWRGIVHRCYRDSAVLSAVAASAIVMGRARHTWDQAIDQYIAPSPFTANKIALNGIPRQRITVKPHGVADPGRRITSPSLSTFVLYVGRLAHEKGVSELVDAWSRVHMADLDLVLVGDGPLRRSLEERRVPRVKVLGWRGPEEVQHLMLGARALAFPSVWYECFPYVVVEALAAGLPVMSAGLGGMDEIARQLGPGWVAARQNPSGWPTALLRLSNSDFVDTAGGRARQLYEANYTLEHSVSELLRLYARLTSSPGAAS